MIGPGTGLAPFRGFLQERAARKAKGATLGPAMLFFGCRHPEQDFLYADELKAFAADGITELYTAFSRADGPKTYVQHLVAAEKDKVWQLIEQGAIIFVCGDGGKMEPDVKAALVAIYRERIGRGCRGRRALDRGHGREQPLRAGRLGGRIAPGRYAGQSDDAHHCPAMRASPSKSELQDQGGSAMCCQFRPRATLPPARAVVYERFATGSSELAAWMMPALVNPKIRHMIGASADRHFNRGMAWKID